MAAARILLNLLRVQQARAAPRGRNKQNTNEFKMLLQTFAWHKESGWSAPMPAGMDSEATLAVMFGGNPVEECGFAIAEAALRLPNSVLLGCSTAGEIFGAQVQDLSLSLAVARFARVTLRKTSLVDEA